MMVKSQEEVKHKMFEYNCTEAYEAIYNGRMF